MSNSIKKNEMGGHVARMGETRCTYRVLVGKRDRRKPFEDVGVEGRIKLKRISLYEILCIVYLFKFAFIQLSHTQKTYKRLV